MATARCERFIRAQLVWMLGATLILVLLDSLSYELVLVMSLIGFLVVVELITPVAATPAWRRRFLWLIGGGLVAFGYIVVRRILDILPPGVF